MTLTLWKNRHLIFQLTKRDVLARYRGSLFGVLWSLLSPILMLVVYTFVFGIVFQARWANAVSSQGMSSFALILFSGLICFNLLAESVTRAPTAVSGNPNYVKKVVFPIEVVPLVMVLSAVWNALLASLVLIVGKLLVTGSIPATSLFFPLVLLPLVLTASGLAWFLASLGVFIRDITHIVPLVVSALLFVSPIFYPLDAVPETLRRYLWLNPVSPVVENARRVLVFGQSPDLTLLGVSAALGVAVCVAGYMWFVKTRKGFADVV
jgi:lipopolysaccharide transport system permease protein